MAIRFSGIAAVISARTVAVKQRNLAPPFALATHVTTGKAAMSKGTTGVVLAALSANLGIAAVKLIAAAFTGSAAMFAEGIHSLVDTGNQGLLLLGIRRSKRPADEKHPFGYGREIYFWAFVVAVMLFTAGGIVAIIEGVTRLTSDHAIDHPILNLAIIGVAVVLEGYSFSVALREFRANASCSWLRAIEEEKDPTLYIVLLEDSAALTGLVVALIGLSLAWATGNEVFDAAASIVIGLVLLGTAVYAAQKTMTLLIGESAAPEVLDEVRRLISETPGTVGVARISTIHNGPHDISLTALVDFENSVPAGEVEQALAATRVRIRDANPDIKRVFLVPAELG
jgi:cation diffusion facilitator family transporter